MSAAWTPPSSIVVQTGAELVAQRPRTPRTALVVIWLFTLAAALQIAQIVGGVMADFGHGSIHTVIHTGSGSDDDIALTVAILLIINLSQAAVFVAAYVVFAVFTARGFGWPRYAMIAITAVSALIGAVGHQPHRGFELFGTARGVIVIAAIVFAFLPSSRAWFREMKAWRSARRQHARHPRLSV